ncbi:hypothetical protein E6W39_01605 [Kitasatospora acidiphila]|uniref:Uncharacterized protein n=1 Tax=Kitasatospora acidiphila TaxID=2567942 RepID=A0A540VWT7_9ACTN|nr:hypothetical protein [Kitasatospora acidiphila]TQF01167.1 hypothetical protein E6W39_01605 [Kitasatospora acidiphila]
MTERAPQLPVAALRFSFALATAFTVFAYVTTQLRAVRAGSPWQDDPYDVVVSFTVFLVPALSALTALRALLCRGGRPQPFHRVDQLLRAARLSTLLVAATMVADCTAAALRADHQHWNGETPWLIASLVPLTVAAAVGLLLLWQAFGRLPGPARELSEGADWLTDLALLIELATVRLPGPLRRPASRLAPGALAAFARDHITAVAAAASLTAGLGLAVGQALGEGPPGPVLFVIEVGIASGGFFAFCMLCNSVLRIAAPRRSGQRWRAAIRRAAVAAALAVPVTTGLRDPLQRVVGPVDTLGELAGLLVCAALLAGSVTFAVTLGRRQRS